MTQIPLGGLPYVLPKFLMVDVYGPNPLIADLSVRNQPLFELASERAPAPTLFATGDLPPFTASGVDPQLLGTLPYNWRHAAASESSPATVLAWLEEAAQDPAAFTNADGKQHPGLEDYQARVQVWVAGLKTPDVTFEEAGYPVGWQTPRMRAAIEGRGGSQ